MKSNVLKSVKETTKAAVEGTKAALKGASKKALGVVGAFVDPTTTSETDQPGTGNHGGKKVKLLRNMN